MGKLGINRDDLKKKNRGLVLKMVATGRATSRIELSKQTGLTKTAISQIVNDLIENDFLEEAAKKNLKEVGRKPIGLTVSGGSPKYVGIMIYRGYAEAVLCDMRLMILKYKKVPREWYTAQELMETVYSLIDEMLLDSKNVFGIGIASIGPVDVKQGKIMAPPFFHDVKNVDIMRLVAKRYGLPVCFDFDNQSAALAEKLYGNGKDCQDIIMVGVGRGVGCGIIVKGERYQNNSVPELGHVSIDYQGNPCICGNTGCLETYVSSHIIRDKMADATGWDYDYRTFCEHTDTPAVDAIMKDVIKKLACAVISVLNILNSEMIILGHDCVYWPEKYLRLLEEEVNRRKFGMKDRNIPVKKAYYLEKTHVLGAACNVIQQVFAGELV